MAGSTEQSWHIAWGDLRDGSLRRLCGITAGDPDGFRTGEEFVRRPLDESPGAKIKFKLGGTFQIFNPTFGVCVEPHGGAARQTVGLLR